MKAAVSRAVRLRECLLRELRLYPTNSREVGRGGGGLAVSGLAGIDGAIS